MTTETEVAGKTVTLYKFTNKATSPWLDSVLAMFYQGADANAIGIMEAWNLDTEKEEMILVGVQLDADGKPDCFPIASCLSAEDVGRYLAPDGKGGFYDPANPSEAADYKDSVRSFDEAVVDEPVH